MAITISGANNVDKILATDGVLDSISGFNVVGVMTAGTFDVTGKTTTGHLNIGSNIQIGNAGIITATTLVGNVTGNINHTSNLLLQIGGSEKFRVGSSGQLGIAGANYGSSGQVLTSGGSGAAASWNTISSTTINNNANNRIITGSGTANTLEAETTLEWNGTNKLTSVNQGSGYPDFIFSIKTVAGGGESERFRVGNGPFRIGNTNYSQNSYADALVVGSDYNDRGITIVSGNSNEGNIFFGDDGDNDIGKIQYVHSDNSMRFTTNTGERLRITSGGRLGLGVASPQATMHIEGGSEGNLLQLSNTHTGATNSDGFVMGINSSLTYLYNRENKHITFGTNNTERLRIDTNGKLTLSNSEGIQLSAKTSSLYASDGSISYYATNNAVYINGAGASGWMRLSAAGTANNRTAINIYGHSYATADQIDFRTNSTERLRIASDGKIFVANEAGTIDTTARLGEGNRFQLSGLSSNDGFSVVRYSTGYGAWGLNLGRSRSGTLGTNTILADNDDIGHITFWGADGSDFNKAAQISAEVDGTPSGGTDMPGALVFKTSAEASGTPTERLRITSDGDLLRGSTGLNNSSVAGQAIQISGTTRPTLILRGNSSGSNVGEIQFADNSGTDSDPGTRAGMIQYNHHGGNFMAFHVNNDSVPKFRINSWGGLSSVNSQYSGSDKSYAYYFSFHKSGTYNTFTVDIGFNNPGGYNLEMLMGGYDDRQMHTTFQGYVYDGNHYGSVGAIDSGSGPQRSFSTVSQYGSYGTKMRFQFTSMSATHVAVEMRLTYGPAGGTAEADITAVSWS